MKKLLCVLSVFLFVNLAFGAEKMNPMVQSRVQDLFIHSDEGDWDALRNDFSDKVRLDYSSFTGNPAAELSSDQIVNAWSGFLPLFQSTHHQISNFKIQVNGSTAAAFCYGTATHYFPNPSGNNVWTVVGTYDFQLVKSGNDWRISAMTFNFKYQDGNLELPKLIQEKK